MPNWDSNSPAQFGWDPAFSGWVPFVFQGRSFPQGVHPGVHAVFTLALERLVADGLQLPPVSMGLNIGCWGQQGRPIAGTNTPSFHSYGLALDVAAPWNAQGSLYIEQSPYRLPDNTSSIVEPLGILWGGSPRFAPTYDRMHLEFHGSPAEAARYGSSKPPTTPVRRPYPLPQGYYYGPYEGPAQSISGSGRQDAGYRPGLEAAQHVLGTNPDGFYGPMTAAAARSWQTKHHLVADGLIGPATWASLFP